jgi:hypothetical protein
MPCSYLFPPFTVFFPSFLPSLYSLRFFPSHFLSLLSSSHPSHYSLPSFILLPSLHFLPSFLPCEPDKITTEKGELSYNTVRDRIFQEKNLTELKPVSDGRKEEMEGRDGR